MDWVGNTNSIFKTLGATNHAQRDRAQYDYYATEPKAIELLLELEKFGNVWECACGEGHLAKVLDKYGLLAKATDLIDRGYGTGEIDFLNCIEDWNGDIITNPPYKYAEEFVRHSLNVIAEGRKVAMFLAVQFLEGQKRRKLFDISPPKIVYCSSSRLNCGLNGNFRNDKGSPRFYCWFIWQKGFKGDTVIKWFN